MTAMTSRLAAAFCFSAHVGLRMLVIGLGAAGIGFLIGLLFHTAGA
jgi:VIT1/CCC1 family predicted Fe2+/Mn2+ transporter